MLGRGRSFAGVAYSNIVRAARFSSSEFIVQRSKYKAQLSEMRKGWMEEIARRNELKQQQIKEERERMVREKAVRLRQRRQESLLRQEQDRKLKAAALARFRVKLARNHLVWEERAGVQQYRFKRLVEDLKRESPVWITKETLNTQITPDLFDKPSTTGYHTRYSDMWRITSTSYNYELARLLNPEQFLESDETKTAADRLQEAFAQRSFYRRQEIEAFLAPMVRTGEDRRRLPELVDEFLTVMKDQDREYDALHDKLDLMDELDRYEEHNDVDGNGEKIVPDDSDPDNDLEDADLRYNPRTKQFDVYKSDLSDTSESESDSDGHALAGADSDGEGEGSDVEIGDEDEEAYSQLLIMQFDDKYPETAATRDAAILLRSADDQVHRVEAANIRWDYAKATYNVETMHDLRRALYVYRRLYGVNLLREDVELSDMASKLQAVTLVESDISASDDDEEVAHDKHAFRLAGASRDRSAAESADEYYSSEGSDLEYADSDEYEEGEHSGEEGDYSAEEGEFSGEEGEYSDGEFPGSEGEDGEEEDHDPDGDAADLEHAIGRELIRRGVLTSDLDGARRVVNALDELPEFDEPDKDLFGQVVGFDNVGAPVNRRGYQRRAGYHSESEAEEEAGSQNDEGAADSAAAAGGSSAAASKPAKAASKGGLNGFFDDGEVPKGGRP